MLCFDSRISHSEDVEHTCDAVIKLYGRFFEVLPKLLKGLEFERIVAE